MEGRVHDSLEKEFASNRSSIKCWVEAERSIISDRIFQSGPDQNTVVLERLIATLLIDVKADWKRTAKFDFKCFLRDSPATELADVHVFVS